MIRENITITSNETVIKVHNTEVNAIRSKNIKRQGVRVYQEGVIGIGGAIGEVEESVLIQQAKDNLEADIPYPYEATRNLVDQRDYSKKIYKPSELKTLTEEVLTVLRDDYPEFSFTHMVKYKEDQVSMTNTEGLNLSYKDSFLDMTFLIKEKTSANLFDGAIFWMGRELDMDKYWAFNRPMLEAYKTSAELPEGDKLPVFFIDNAFQGFLSKHLNGEVYASNGSLYTGKMGEQLFDEKLTVYHNQNPKETNQPFFDMEGIVMKEDKQVLIEKGKLTAVLTDKKTAADYDMPHTGGASGDYDSRPALNRIAIDFETTGTDIKKALNGKPGIFAVMSSGGDFTPDGSYAAPVQIAFLFDGEKCIGKLEEFAISSHIDQMLGEDYIGAFESEHFYFGEHSKVIGSYMTIQRNK